MRAIAISGVSRGIGEGVARAFIDAGWTVHGFGRRAPAWTQADGAQFRFHACDMADHIGLGAACAGVDEPLEVLLCNAASFGSLAFHLREFDPVCFAETLSVNVVAPAVMARALRQRLMEGSQRLIVMMSTGNASLAGNVSGTMMAYRASKSALNQLVRNLAAEWSGDGFTSIALNPGWVRTDMGGEAAPTSVADVSVEIVRFVQDVASHCLNGQFVNTDGSSLPW